MSFSVPGELVVAIARRHPPHIGCTRRMNRSN